MNSHKNHQFFQAKQVMQEVYSIVAEDLYFSYDGRPILKDVSVEIPQGDYWAIIGPNGGERPRFCVFF